MSTVFGQEFSESAARVMGRYQQVGAHHPGWADTYPLEESECNAPPHFGTPFDPIVQLHREESEHGMQMLVWAFLLLVSVVAGVLVWVLR